MNTKKKSEAPESGAGEWCFVIGGHDIERKETLLSTTISEHQMQISEYHFQRGNADGARQSIESNGRKRHLQKPRVNKKGRCLSIILRGIGDHRRHTIGIRNMESLSTNCPRTDRCRQGNFGGNKDLGINEKGPVKILSTAADTSERETLRRH